MRIETLEEVFSGDELEALVALRPRKSWRSWWINEASQACILSIGASWGHGRLTSVRVGNGPRYLAFPFWVEQKKASLVVGLRYTEDWNFDRFLFADFHWFRHTQFPNFATSDREWAWIAYARVALHEGNQTKPIFGGKVKTAYKFLEA